MEVSFLKCWEEFPHILTLSLDTAVARNDTKQRLVLRMHPSYHGLLSALVQQTR
jgi:hypothetical protein